MREEVIKVFRIEKLTTQAEQEWDDYVQASDKGTFYHQIGWRNAVEGAYRWKSHYLIAKQNAKIIGILPLFVIGGFPLDKALISLPFAPYGGMCADDHDTENKLFEAACELARRENVDYVEFRHLDKVDLDLKLNDEFTTLILELDSDPEKVWESFRSEIRNRTRKAVKSGLEIKVGNQYLPEFYNIYAENMRDLGTPVHSLALLKNLIQELPESVQVFVVLSSSQVIGGMFLMFYKDTAIDMWASSLRKFSRYCPANLLYWEAIKYSCEKGYRYFDCGRSKWNSGTFKFKERLGAQPNQLYYQNYSPKPGKVSGLNASDLKVRCFISIWKRLPVFIANPLGPVLRRYIP
jgi:FemAB-related protein (PEP-CTERM system-associated)